MSTLITEGGKLWICFLRRTVLMAKTVYFFAIHSKRKSSKLCVGRSGSKTDFIKKKHGVIWTSNSQYNYYLQRWHWKVKLKLFFLSWNLDLLIGPGSAASTTSESMFFSGGIQYHDQLHYWHLPVGKIDYRVGNVCACGFFSCLVFKFEN